MNRKKTVCYNIKAAWHTISCMYNGFGIEHNVSISMGYVLINLSTEKSVPSTHIAPLLGMEARSLTRLLKSMEEQKLIKKQIDILDKRQVNIYLTDTGNKKKAIVAKIIKDFNHILLSKIDKSELLIFNKVLEQITNITEHNFKEV